MAELHHHSAQLQVFGFNLVGHKAGQAQQRRFSASVNPVDCIERWIAEQFHSTFIVIFHVIAFPGEWVIDFVSIVHRLL